MSKIVSKSTSAAGVVLAMALTFSCSLDKDGDSNDNSSPPGGYTGSYGSVSHGGQTYKTVVIGTQTWMAENLNYDPGKGNSTCYHDQTNNCAIYGRLYDWSTAMDFDPTNCNSNSCTNLIYQPHRGICPSGYHIPSDADWETLITAVGGSNTAGIKLKATGWLWVNCGIPYSDSGDGKYSYEWCEDTYGFSALPGGGGYYNSGMDGRFGYWWSAAEGSQNSLTLVPEAYYRYMQFNYKDVRNFVQSKRNWGSVRCVKDE
jgi:uncharacterized protein (TIGR02145 family)